jgi:predicted flavoprotein YhiN
VRRGGHRHGGLSIPKIGATDFGYRVAKQFDLPAGHAPPGAGAADL